MRIKVIDAVDLAESSCHKPGLQSHNLANFILLVLEDEFAADDLTTVRTGSEIPGLVLHERVEFVSCHFLPLSPACRMIDGFLNCGRLLFVIGIGVPCHLCHMGPLALVEIFVGKLC